MDMARDHTNTAGRGWLPTHGASANMGFRPGRNYLVPDSDGLAAASSDVFVSYASQDAAIANAVVAALEQQGLKCWIAPRDVTPGALYADGIIGAINGTKVLVLVLSASSIASAHVSKEVERASSKRRPIIALRIDSAPLTSALEYFLSESQWIDLAADGTGAAFAKLLSAVRRPGGAPGRHALDGASASARPSARLPRSWLLVAALIVAGVAIAWLAIDRFRSFAAARQALAAPAAFAPPPHSIAVLPFVNMSGDAGQDYFSDGISEELLNALSRLNDLQVAARTSSFSFKGRNVDVATIAHQLNVGAVLEGSVRRAGNTVRITVQLINAVTGFHIWSQTYDRNLTDILKVQTDVATSVAQQLEGKLVGDEAVRIEMGGTDNPEAYDAYLRGKHLLAMQDPEEARGRTAIAAFDQAIALDPRYALAYGGRAAALGDFAIFNAKPAEQTTLRAQALQAAQRAVELAPELGETHLVLAEIRAFLLLDYAGAAPEFDRALALAPGSAQVQRAYAGYAADLGHFEPAVQAARRSLSLDPQDVNAHTTLGMALYLARRYDEALVALQHARALNPDSHYIQYAVTLSLLASGQTPQARAQCESSSIPMDEDFRHHCLALVYHRLGRQADAERELQQLKALDGDASAYGYASIYAQWGDKNQSLQWLATAQRLHSPSLQALRVDWQLDPIRGEPQFRQIESQMNMPP
jgi:TolB-like protein/cytochrome c-type biogenesis protein CcmH/NrfG